jgi:phosphoribosyl 1,2-cyclic phosphodiesterase
VASGSDTILIDATRDFATQARRLDRVDLVLLTHPHRDAAGGVPRLERWLAHGAATPIPLVSAAATLRTVRTRHRRLDHLVPHVMRGALDWRGVRITALAVPHARDCTTLAWRLDRGGRSLVYASDVARLTPRLAAFSAGCDLLVLDGATWVRRIFTHLEIRATAPIVARWPVGRVVFTQLGRSTPPHDRLDAWLRAIDPRLGAARDDLELEISSARTATTGVSTTPRARAAFTA